MGRAPEARGGSTRLVTVKAVSDAYPLRGQAARAATGRGPRKSSSARRRRRARPGSTRRCSTRSGLKVGDPLLLGDATPEDRPRHRHRAGPRRRLPQLRAAGADERSRPRRDRPRSSRRAASPTGSPSPRRDGSTGAARRRGSSSGPKPRPSDGTLRGLRVESLESGRPEMRQTLDRAEKFLNLVALLAALLAAVAVGIASRDFAQPPPRRLRDAARARPVAAHASRCSTRSSSRSSALLASAAGVAARLRGPLRLRLAARRPGAAPTCRRRALWPALFGVGVGFTLLMGFGLPPVLQLARVPPLRVIRRDVGALKPASLGGARRPARSASSRCCWRCRATSSSARSRSAASPPRSRCSPLLSWLAVAAAAARGARVARAALAGAGDAPDRRAAGLRGAAGLGAERSACWRWCCWCCCAPT